MIKYLLVTVIILSGKIHNVTFKKFDTKNQCQEVEKYLETLHENSFANLKVKCIPQIQDKN